MSRFNPGIEAPRVLCRITLLLPALLVGMLALETASPLMAANVNRDFLWEGTPVWIKVCWENPNAASAARRNWVRDAVESSWSRYARVNFVGWGKCNARSDVRIRIDNTRPSQVPGFWEDGLFRNGRYIDGLRNNVILNLDPGGWCRGDNGKRRRCIRAVAVQRFGYVLGFWSEEERDDYFPDGDRNRNGIDDVNEDACRKGAFGTNNYAPQKYGSYDVDSVMSHCGQPADRPQTWRSTLSAGDIASVQRAYGRRIPGSLVSPRADCVTSRLGRPENEPVNLWDCNEARDGQEWAYANPHLYLGADRCLENEYWSNHPGDATLVNTCGEFPSQEWVFENVEIRGWGGLCLDLEGGDTTNGTNIKIWECGAFGGANQKWSITESGMIKYGDLSSDKCVYADPDGRVYITDCVDGCYPQRFDLLPGGEIRSQYNGKCLDVAGPRDSDYLAGHGLPRNGTDVGTFDCLADQLNQKWSFHGPVKHPLTGLCLDRTRNSSKNGTPIRIWNCNGAPAQQWEYYFLGR